MSRPERAASAPPAPGTPDDGFRLGRGLSVLLVLTGTLGLLAAMVLTIDRFRLLVDPSAHLACNVSPFIACGPVMQSRAGALLGFPNPLLGIIGFSVLVTTGVVGLAGARLPRWYHQGLQVGVLAAAVFLTWLQTQSLYVIGALCLWCMLVWAVTIPVVVTVTLHNAAAGHLGRRLVSPGAPAPPLRRHRDRDLVPGAGRRDRAALLP